MDINPIIDHQAWIDKDILSSRAEPSLDDFGSFKDLPFLVKGRLFWREARAKARNSGSEG